MCQIIHKLNEQIVIKQPLYFYKSIKTVISPQPPQYPVKVGLNIPAVKKITYVPAIDDERDRNEAEDDKRVPEELKAMAEKYAQAAAELEANAEDDPLGDYFLAIGIEKQRKRRL